MSYNPQNPNGQATMANSSPVVIANDQLAIPISGSISLPTDAATATNQTSGGQKTQVTDSSGNAVKVRQLNSQVVAGDYGLVTNTVIHGISSSGGGNYNDVKATNNGELLISLSDISSVVGQDTMANSIPVTIASNQSSIPVTGTFYQATQPVSIASAVAVTGTFWQATQPVSLTSLPSLAAGSNAIGSITNTSFAVTQATAASLNATVVGTGTFAVQAAQSGTWNVGTLTSITNAVTVSQSTATSLKTQAESYQGGTAVSSTNPLYVTVAASTTGGDTIYRLVSATGTNASNIIGGQRKVTGWYIYNSNASARKVNLYNLNVSPTVGTSAITLAIVVPGLAATNVSFPDGIDFSTGISISTVTDLTDAGTTGVGTNDLIINLRSHK